jgi:hypothetical protein
MKTIIKSLQKTLTILLIMSSTAHAEKVCETIGECQDLADKIAKRVNEIRPGCELKTYLVPDRQYSASFFVVTPREQSMRSYFLLPSPGNKLVIEGGRLNEVWTIYNDNYYERQDKGSAITDKAEIARKILLKEFHNWIDIYEAEKPNRGWPKISSYCRNQDIVAPDMLWE